MNFPYLAFSNYYKYKKKKNNKIDITFNITLLLISH